MKEHKQDPEAVKITKLFFAWNDEEEEKWLEKKASEGWRLESAAPYVYYFRKSTPEKVAIRLDYKNTLDKDYQEYLGIFRGAGWELVVTFANWHYFRINPENDESPEIYNSDRAKAQKYRRLMFAFIPFLPLYIVFLLRITDPSFGSGNSVIDWIYLISKLLMAALILFMGFVLILIVRKIKKLESESKE
jgi:hypothetical protein